MTESLPALAGSLAGWHPRWIFFVVVAAASFGLFEMFMCGFPVWLSLPGFSWHRRCKVCCNHSTSVATILYAHSSSSSSSSGRLHSPFFPLLLSPLLCWLFIWEKSRLKIYKAINNSVPRGRRRIMVEVLWLLNRSHPQHGLHFWPPAMFSREVYAWSSLCSTCSYISTL